MVNPNRVRKLNEGSAAGAGPVVYWMSRDQRVQDNWALLYAVELARQHKQPLMVVFCLRDKFKYATERLVDFMLTGLEEVEAGLAKKNISFYFLLGNPEVEIQKFIKEQGACALVSDFSPLRASQAWKQGISKRIKIPFYEVDAHNIVPCWVASPKQEFGAYTLRPKIHKLLHEYLGSSLTQVMQMQTVAKKAKVNWQKVRSEIHVDATVPKVDWIVPGEKAAQKMLQHFITHKLKNYNEDRNDPTKDAQSKLSPYIHFGHISSEQVVLEVLNATGFSLSEVLDKHTTSTDPLKLSAIGFIEELVVRKELSDNFCFYNPHYDSVSGFPAWAKKTLAEHAGDEREYIYTRDELECAQTHDELWNAAQLEMMYKGKMHGYMRMYWAKKIYEWSKNAEDAIASAIYLNNKYFLDGRDPNGYAGIAWSIGGVHDRAWFERSIFGKIRYMSFGGAKSKFKVKDYVAQRGGLGPE